jgi:hypothetical protein
LSTTRASKANGESTNSAVRRTIITRSRRRNATDEYRARLFFNWVWEKFCQTSSSEGCAGSCTSVETLVENESHHAAIRMKVIMQPYVLKTLVVRKPLIEMTGRTTNPQPTNPPTKTIFFVRPTRTNQPTNKPSLFHCHKENASQPSRLSTQAAHSRLWLKSLLNGN